MGDRLVAIDVGRKSFWRGAEYPSSTIWPGPRPTSMPNFILIHPTVWPQYTNVTDRQTDRTGQRSHSIGRTVLPMVVQKLKQGNRVTLHPRCALPSPHAATEWSVLLLNDVICSERVTVHCVIGNENPQNCAFPLGFCHRAGGGPSHGHKQHAQKVGKDRTCGTEDIVGQTDRHAILITMLRHRSCGRINDFCN